MPTLITLNSKYERGEVLEHSSFYNCNTSPEYSLLYRGAHILAVLRNGIVTLPPGEHTHAVTGIMLDRTYSSIMECDVS